MKMVFGILIIVGAVILIATLAPPYFSNYQFQDVLKTESQMTTYTTKTEDVIRDEVFKKAQEMDIPISKEQIKVVRNGVVGTGTVEIDASYIVHVNLPGYPMDLHFEASARNKGVF
jgi:predicted amino acid dehydrogenase